jgi:plasmid rolling circle replication initiator protein Rep
MNESQRKIDEIFEESFSKGVPIYWWYDYEDAVFRSEIGNGKVRYFVKYARGNSDEFELFTQTSNVLMDSISDLNKVLITKSDYEQFPKKQEFKK